MKLLVWIEDFGHTAEHADTFESSKWVTDVEDAVTEYAEYFHSHRDGWECDWPIVFTVQTTDGNVQKFSVEREAQPVFISSLVDKT